MSLKGKAAAIGIGELKPLKDPGDETRARPDGESGGRSDRGRRPRKAKTSTDSLVGMPFADPGMIYPASAAEVLGSIRGCSTQVDIGGASPGRDDLAGGGGYSTAECATRCCAWSADLNHTGDQRPPVISVQREFEAPYGMIGANCGYAMIASRHMYGIRHHGAADGESRGRPAQERDEESARDV